MNLIPNLQLELLGSEYTIVGIDLHVSHLTVWNAVGVSCGIPRDRTHDENVLLSVVASKHS